MLRDNTESVYNLLPPPASSTHKKHVYPKSMYDKERDTFMTHLKTARPRATFGHPIGSLKPHTDDFLKKHSKEPGKNTNVIVIHTPRMKFKPPIPHEQPVRGTGSGRNYVTCNALEVIHATPKKLPKHIPSAVEKPDYGKIPKYLGKLIKILKEKRAKVMLEPKRQGLGTQPNTRRLEESEKQELIEGLKKKWQQINTAYQKTSVTLDTWAKRARKEAFEEQLMQIEKDIQTLSRRVVLVVDKEKSLSSSSYSDSKRKHLMSHW